MKQVRRHTLTQVAQAAGRLLLSLVVLFTLMVPTAFLSSVAAYAGEQSAAADKPDDAAGEELKQKSQVEEVKSVEPDDTAEQVEPDSNDASGQAEGDEVAPDASQTQADGGNENTEQGEAPIEEFKQEQVEPEKPADKSQDSEPVEKTSAENDAAKGEPVRQEAAETVDSVAPTARTEKASRLRSQSKSDEDPVKIESARLLIMDPVTGEYVLFDKTTTEGKPCKVAAVRDAAYFDVQLNYSDGTVKRASEAGVGVKWKLGNNVKDGRTVASVDGEGKVSISGISSKLVQLKATVSGVKVIGSPAYVNLVSDTIAPDSGEAIDSVSITYTGSGEGASTGTVAPVNDVASAGDGVAEEDVPAITQAGGSLDLDATVTYVDASGNKRTSDGSMAGAQLVWQIVALYDEMQEQADVLIATLWQDGQKATLKATQAGNGWVALRCASNAYPEFAGQELLVRIVGNVAASGAVVAASTISEAKLVYEDVATGSYKPYAGSIANTPTAILSPGGSVSFDAELSLEGGGNVLASQCGLAVDYALAGLVSAGTTIAKMAPDGTLTATKQKNGTVRIAGATVNGKTVGGTPAYVRIANNDASIRPTSDSLDISALSNYWVGASQRPDDVTQDWYWRAVLTTGTGSKSVPLVVLAPSSTSSCKLSASIRWTNSAVTTSQEQDGGERSWSVVKSVDYDGKACSALVAVGSDGTVRPIGSKSGYATVLCTVDLPVYDSDGNRTTRRLSGEYKVAVYASQNYVKKMVLLDEKGSPIQTSAIKLASGKNTYNFSALITYVGYNEEAHRVEEYEVNTKTDPQKAVGLTWKVYRSEERVNDELYSQIRDDGSFRALSGFARGFVYANMPHASFTGKDIGVGVSVIAEDSIEYLGHTDSMTVTMYHYSDYLNHGEEAKPAKEVELTRGQLEGLADYTTWYTFHRRGDAFSTAYARGLTMRTLLAVCGVDPDRLISMVFTGTDGYFAERHSASFILGTQYRYTNYYYYKDLPGLVGAQSVSPMLALSYYMKNNAGYEDATDKNNAGSAGYGYMTNDSTFRVIFGMTGVGIRNANQSISNVNRITIVVEDNTFPPDEEEEQTEPDPKPEDPDVPPPPPEEENGTPGIQGDIEGGDRADEDGRGEARESSNPFNGESNEGVGTDEKQGGTVAVSDKGDSEEVGKKDATNDHNDDKGSAPGQSTQDSSPDQSAQDSEPDQSPQVKEIAKGETDQSGNPLIRELRENPKPVLPPAEIDAIWWMLVVMTAIVALLFGGMFQGRRYAVDRADGLMIRMRNK